MLESTFKHSRPLACSYGTFLYMSPNRQMSDRSTYLHRATTNPLEFDAKQLPTLHPSCYILRSSFPSHGQHRLHLQPVNHILTLVLCETQYQLYSLEYWIPL